MWSDCLVEGMVCGMSEGIRPTGPVVQGEFFTDGESFVFRLAGTPLSGTGPSPQAAYDDLLRVRSASSGLVDRLQALAREQAGEKVRATVIRWSMAALIVFGVVGGALAGGLAMAPAAITAVTDAGGSRLIAWVEDMPPATERKIARLLHGDETCPGADAPARPLPPATGG